MLEEQQVKFHMNNSVTEIQGANGKVSIIVFSSNSKEVRWTFSINCAASGIKGRVTPAKIRILTQLIWESFLWGQTKTVAKIGVAVSRFLWSFFDLQVKAVVLKSGTVLEADLVVAGIGNNMILTPVVHVLNALTVLSHAIIFSPL